MEHLDPLRKHFEACNTTELQQLCRKAGLVVLPNAPREKLIDYLFGDDLPPDVDHPIDSLRNGLIQLIFDHWVMIEPQLTCPAKELGSLRHLDSDQALEEASKPKTVRACYRCEDTKVISCLVENTAHEAQIQIRRKATPQKEEDTTMGTAMGVLTVQTAPRDPSELVKQPRFMLKRLATELGLFQTDDQKVAFIDASSEVQAATLAAGLQEFDKTGGVPAQAPSQPTTSQAASTTAPETTAGGAPPRTPKNGTKKPDATNGAENDSGLAQALLATMKTLVEELAAIRKQLGQMEAIAAGRHQTVEKTMADVAGVVKTCLAANIVLAENLLSMPPSTLLEEAAEQLGRLELGKAAGKG